MAKLKNCEWCGAEFEDKYRDGKRFCGRSCASYYRNATYGHPTAGKIGELNPNWKGTKNKPCLNCGKSLGEKAYTGNVYCSRKCYAAHRLIKNKVTIQCKTCGKTFDVLPHDINRRRFCSHECFAKHPDIIQRTKDIHTGKNVSEHTRQAMSISSTKRNAEQVYTSGRNGHHDSSKAGNIFYRSSYEQVAYQLLDNDITVVGYKPEPFVIEYINLDGNVRRYRPDILVEYDDGTKVIVEIKPSWQLDNPKFLCKAAYAFLWARSNNMTYEIWTEARLGLFNYLKKTGHYQGQTGATPHRGQHDI